MSCCHSERTSAGATAPPRERRIGRAEEVPAFQRCLYILDWYRLENPRLQHFFCIHNEAGNMWTHIASAIFMVARFVRWLENQEPPWQLEWPRGLYAAGVMSWFVMSIAVLTVSVAYHWKRCSSEKVFCRWLCLDMSFCAGLVFVGFCSGIPMGFHCFPQIRLAYIGLSALVISLTAATFTRIPKEDDDARFTHLMVATMFFLVPALHWLIISTRGRQAIGCCFGACAVFGVLGGSICKYSIPECYAPGRFDLIGHSHQIWHVLIFGSILCYTECLVDVFALTSSQEFCL